MVDLCYEDVYEGSGIVELSVSDDENVRRRRHFEDKIEEQGRKLLNADQVVDLFVSKTNTWNDKIFMELLSTKKENQQAREEVREALDAGQKARQDLQHELDAARATLVSNQKTMMLLINQTNTVYVEYEYRFAHIGMFISDFIYNTSTVDKPPKEWTYGQSPGITLGYAFGIISAICGKFPDDLLGGLVAKANGFRLNLCQQVKKLCLKLKQVFKAPRFTFAKSFLNQV